MGLGWGQHGLGSMNLMSSYVQILTKSSFIPTEVSCGMGEYLVVFALPLQLEDKR
jgi:hypothetical protein